MASESAAPQWTSNNSQLKVINCHLIPPFIFCLRFRKDFLVSSMTKEHSRHADLKQRAKHELQDFAGISIYLAFFFCALATYSMLLLGKFHISYFKFGTALINALVVAKIIMIGEYARVGKRAEARPLLISAVYKALLFALLVLAFHFLEETIRHLVHGAPLGAAPHDVRMNDFLGRGLVVFCTFVPLFAFRELRRVLGEETFHSLFFRGGSMPDRKR
jgi:hypothetical protein